MVRFRNETALHVNDYFLRRSNQMRESMLESLLLGKATELYCKPVVFKLQIPDAIITSQKGDG